MNEIDLRKVSKLTDIDIKELRQMRIDFPFAFESIVIGSLLIDKGFEFGELMFLSEYRFRPERKDVMDELVVKEKRIRELEDALLDVGVELEAMRSA